MRNLKLDFEKVTWAYIISLYFLILYTIELILKKKYCC